MRLAFLLLLFSFTVLALEEDAVVKVHSGVCGYEEKAFRGSGFGFSFEGKSFTVTSEHVVLHANEKFCHFVWHETFGKVSAKLKLAEYGNGLALLELERFVPELPEFEAIRSVNATENMALLVTGYAYSQNELIFENRGSVVVPKSSRKLIPLVPKVIETKEAHGEFGMSGGPVFSENRKFVGVLSHQYVRLLPGRRSLVEEFSSKSQIENHLLVIPAETVLQWLNSILKAQSIVSSFFLRDAESQIKGKQVILSSGLRFEALASDKTKFNPVGGTDGVGVGGTDGVGIGGTDGVGVGGEPPAHDTVSVSISLDPFTTNTLWYLPNSQNWLVSVRQTLRLPWNKVEVPFFLSKNETRLEVISILSLSDFFQKLASSDVESVTLIHSSEQNRPIQEGAEKLKEIGKEIKETLKGINRELYPSDTLILLNSIEVVGDLLEKESWYYISPFQLERLLNVKEHSEWWKPLFNKDFDTAAKLFEKLLVLKTLIEKLTI